jgi:SH3-like domain-containing protein
MDQRDRHDPRASARRKKPSQEAAIVSTAPQSSIMLVHSCQKEWCDVSWKDKLGWTKKDNLYMHNNITDEDED